MSDILKFVNKKLDVYPPITTDAMQAISDFSLLWNIYDNRYFNTQYSNVLLKKNIEEQKISLSDLDIPLLYFKGRYLTNGVVNSTFEKLDFRGNDFKDEVRAALEYGVNKQELTFAMMMILYRFRCNLFHGKKDVASFNMQKDNFEIANAVLTDIITNKPFLSETI